MSQAAPRILFMGTPEFAVPSLRALIDAGESVVAVVTQPDRPKGRGRVLTPPPVKVLAQEAGIPVLQPVKIRTEEFLSTLRGFAPDVILVAAYGRILTAPILTLPPHGCINVHGSLLPRHRGAAPVQWAVLAGDRETGITIMRMDEGLDTGDMLLAASLSIDDHDTAGTLAPRLAELGARLLLEAVTLLKQGGLKPVRQNDSLATLAPPLAKEDGAIRWEARAQEIGCRIRGLDPWPSAFTGLAGKRLRLFAPEVVPGTADAAPGTILRADRDGLLIATGDGGLLIREVQQEGGRRMPLADFLRGCPIAPGTVLSFLAS